MTGNNQRTQMALRCNLLVVVWAGLAEALPLAAKEKSTELLYVNCTFEVVAEDHFEQRAHFVFGMCNTDEGFTYYIPDVSMLRGDIRPELELVLSKEDPVQEFSARRVRSAAPVLPSYASQSIFRIVRYTGAPELYATPGQRRLRPEVVHHVALSILTIRLSYNDAESRCSESCLEQQMWGPDTSGISVASLVQSSSYGKATIPRESGTAAATLHKWL